MWHRDSLIGQGCSVVQQSGSYLGNHDEGFPSDDALAGAHRLALEHGIFDRPLGVAGIWGAIIRRWLDDLLPSNAVELCSGRVRLVVTEVWSTAFLCCAATMPGHTNFCYETAACACWLPRCTASPHSVALPGRRAHCVLLCDGLMRVVVTEARITAMQPGGCSASFVC